MDDAEPVPAVAQSADGGEIRAGTVFYTLPDRGACGVVRLVAECVLLPEVVGFGEPTAIIAQRGRYWPGRCYLSEREAVAVALAETRSRIADLCRREMALVEQAQRLGVPAGAEESAPLTF